MDYNKLNTILSTYETSNMSKLIDVFIKEKSEKMIKIILNLLDSEAREYLPKVIKTNKAADDSRKVAPEILFNRSPSEKYTKMCSDLKDIIIPGSPGSDLIKLLISIKYSTDADIYMLMLNNHALLITEELLKYKPVKN